MKAVFLFGRSMESDSSRLETVVRLATLSEFASGAKNPNLTIISSGRNLFSRQPRVGTNPNTVNGCSLNGRISCQFGATSPSKARRQGPEMAGILREHESLGSLKSEGNNTQSQVSSVRNRRPDSKSVLHSSASRELGCMANASGETGGD